MILLPQVNEAFPKEKFIEKWLFLHKFYISLIFNFLQDEYSN
jgi:hypothetical protein